MRSRGEQALLDLQAAVFAIERYGSDHLATRGSIGRAGRSLAEATRDGTLRVVFFKNRVIIGDAIAPNPREFVGALGALLFRHTLQCIEAQAGIGPADIVSFAQGLLGPAADDAERIGATLLHATPLATGGGLGSPGSGTPAVATNADLCRSLASVHTGILRADGARPGELEAITQAVMFSFAGGGAPMLELVTIERHDQYTMAHSVNVSILAGALASRIGVSDKVLERIVIAAMLHDIGKREVPREVLLKAGPLTDEERKLVSLHPAAGARILLDRDDVPKLASIVAYEHHRRIDGKGYPERPSAAPPSIAAQIVQIADIYDALRTARPYRAALPRDEVLTVMSRDAGLAFDRALFEVFADHIAHRVPGADPARHAA
jgi:putative nucleotidyltransferase with HDIG domain